MTEPLDKLIAGYAPRWIERRPNEDTGHFVIQADGTDEMLATIQAILPLGASAEYHDSGETILVYPPSKFIVTVSYRLTMHRLAKVTVYAENDADASDKAVAIALRGRAGPWDDPTVENTEIVAVGAEPVSLDTRVVLGRLRGNRS